MPNFGRKKKEQDANACKVKKKRCLFFGTILAEYIK